MTTLDDNRGDWCSASNADYDRACRGRRNAQLGLPELPKTPESTTGERIHAFLAGEQIALTPEESEAALACEERANGIIEKWRAA